LCFVGNIPIKKFLEQKLPHTSGQILEEGGKVLGKHDGAWFFTIGQRQGLNLPPDRYVIKIDVKKNIVHVGPRKDETLNKKNIGLHSWHWIGKKYESPLEVQAKIRYRQIEPITALLSKNGKMIAFEEEQWAVAPGQVVVAYIGDECLGSGIIA
jgi:tRNA-uridine 2-sulfurtransferase